MTSPLHARALANAIRKRTQRHPPSRLRDDRSSSEIRVCHRVIERTFVSSTTFDGGFWIGDAIGAKLYIGLKPHISTVTISTDFLGVFG